MKEEREKGRGVEGKKREGGGERERIISYDGVAMVPDGPEQALRLGGCRAPQWIAPTPSALFRPQTGSLRPKASRWGWRGPRLLRLDRGHVFRRAVEGLRKRLSQAYLL